LSSSRSWGQIAAILEAAVVKNNVKVVILPVTDIMVEGGTCNCTVAPLAPDEQPVNVEVPGRASQLMAVGVREILSNAFLTDSLAASGAIIADAWQAAIDAVVTFETVQAIVSRFQMGQDGRLRVSTDVGSGMAGGTCATGSAAPTDRCIPNRSDVVYLLIAKEIVRAFRRQLAPSSEPQQDTTGQASRRRGPDAVVRAAVARPAHKHGESPVEMWWWFAVLLLMACAAGAILWYYRSPAGGETGPTEYAPRASMVARASDSAAGAGAGSAFQTSRFVSQS